MVEEGAKKLFEYGVLGVVAGGLAWMVLELQNEVKEGNKENKDLVVQYHTAVINLGHDIEEILNRQTARDVAADETRSEANRERGSTQEKIGVILRRVERFETIWFKAREIDKIRSDYFTWYLNQDALKSGMDAVFPVEDLQALEDRLNIMLNEDIQQLRSNQKNR